PTMVAFAVRLQSRDFGVNKRLSLVNRDAAPARDIEIEVHPVLGDLPFGHLLEEQAGFGAVRRVRSWGVVPRFLADAFRTRPIVPVGEPIRRVGHAVVQGLDPEVRLGGRIRAVEDDLDLRCHHCLRRGSVACSVHRDPDRSGQHSGVVGLWRQSIRRQSPAWMTVSPPNASAPPTWYWSAILFQAWKPGWLSCSWWPSSVANTATTRYCVAPLTLRVEMSSRDSEARTSTSREIRSCQTGSSYWRNPPSNSSTRSSPTLRTTVTDCCIAPPFRSGAGRPSRCARLEPRLRIPVVADRREDVDDDRTRWAGVNLVRLHRQDPPGPAGAQMSRLAIERERHVAADDHAQLLIGVAMFGHDRVRRELDDGQRQVVPLDAPGANRFAEQVDRRDALEVDQIRHGSSSCVAPLLCGRGHERPEDLDIALTGTCATSPIIRHAERDASQIGTSQDVRIGRDKVLPPTPRPSVTCELHADGISQDDTERSRVWDPRLRLRIVDDATI